MIVEDIEYGDEDHTEDLLQRLRGSVFHITTKEAFDHIREDGQVFHNKDGRFPLNTSSESSFGRNRGWVCLFDLRDQSREIIDETLLRYYFLEPHWFMRYEPSFIVSHLAYLILHPQAYDEIVPNETARRVWSETNNYEHYVPTTECWYPGDISLAFVQRVLLVRIRKKDRVRNEF